MAVSTAGISIRNDLLREIDVPAGGRAGIRQNASDNDPRIAERLRKLDHVFEYWGGLASRYGFTEEDVNDAVKEAKEEERAGDK